MFFKIVVIGGRTGSAKNPSYSINFPVDRQGSDLPPLYRF